jgi:drug/metabolite transporter (DMT)-like permease
MKTQTKPKPQNKFTSRKKTSKLATKKNASGSNPIGSAILLIILCTIFTSLGQLFLKFGANRLVLSIPGILADWQLLLGCFFYAIGAIIMILALRKGDLSLIYPFVSLSFIWVALLSLIFLGESIMILQWLGIAIIISGVSLVGWGAKRA